MRIPSSVFAAGRYIALLTLVAGSVLLISAEVPTGFRKSDRASYADPNLVQFVRPGLSVKVVSANIASDGTISVDYKLTDPSGLPLDLSGVQTPGAVSVSFLAAYIPKGQPQFWSYTTRVSTGTAPNGIKGTATQAAADSGGTTQTVAVGEYIYTFKTKAVAQSGGAFDPTVTTRIGIYGSRNLTEFDLGTNYVSTTYDFVPAGGKVASTREVIKNASCNQCHDDLAFHGGSRRGIELCIMCHTPQTSDPDTGNTVDMPVMAHAIHMGSQLPNIAAGKPYYQIIGFGNAVSDWSTVTMPSDIRRCETCHQSTTGAAQANAWQTHPTAAACGACHDNVNFATGANHAAGPEADNSKCSVCHIAQGDLEFDASIKGAHTVPDQSVTLRGVNFALTKVVNGGAGQKPTVTFTLKDNAGNGLTASQFSSLSLVMAGPTSDYGYTSFGSDVTTPGYVSEAATKASCSSDGTCQYTFTHAVPASATGTYAIGIEGRIAVNLYPGTDAAQSVNMAGHNKVIYFSVDGSSVKPRRTVVAEAKCNGCHANLQVHGNLRNDVEYCGLCHNPSNTDASARVSATAAIKSQPAQAINFALMVHKIHSGEKAATDFGTTYVVIGHGGSVNDFSEVRYPVMSDTGSVSDTAKCDMCHVNGSEASFPIGLNAVADPQGLWNPAPATTSACTACHQNKSALAHASAQTDPKFGESCDVCHGSGSANDVNKAHAGK